MSGAKGISIHKILESLVCVEVLAVSAGVFLRGESRSTLGFACVRVDGWNCKLDKFKGSLVFLDGGI